MKAEYCPKRGDLIWLNFTPQAGHEQAGRRPTAVISHTEYNRKAGLVLACPITSRKMGYPFEVSLPEGFGVTGVILADQVRSLDWKSHHAEFIGKLDESVLGDVLSKLTVLIDEPGAH